MRDWRRRAASFALATLAVTLAVVMIGSASAQQQSGGGSKERTITVSVPEEGEHFVRLLPSPDAKQPEPLPRRFLEKTFRVSFQPDGFGSKPRIAVDDPKTGLSAIRPLTGPDAPKGDVLDLKAADFDHVRELHVVVAYEGKPVATARVSLKPRTGPEVSRTLDPAKKGVAIFEDIPMGRGRVTVSYGEGYTQTQDVEIGGGTKGGEPPTITVAVPNRVPTLEDATPPTGEEAGGTGSSPEGVSSSTPPRPEGKGLAGLLGTLLGLAIGAGAIYILYRWAMSGGLAATLKKAGIEVSGPQAEDTKPTPWRPAAPPTPVVADPSLCQFCGQKKDEAGNCACTLAPGAAATPAAPVTQQPRLVGMAGVYAGAIFPLEGAVSVGREPTNGIALPNDNTVSRRHASLRVEAGGCVITDEGSSNGTYVNGVRITAPQTLRPGDEVQIGGTRFRFEM